MIIDLKYVKFNCCGMVFLSIMCFISTSLFSQNYKKDIIEVAKNILELKSYSMDVHYKLYVDNNLLKPFQERLMEVKRFEKCIKLSQNQGIEVVENENYQIMIDKKEKTFTARKKFKEEESYNDVSEYLNLFSGNPDSLFFKYSKVVTLKDSKDKVMYDMFLKPNDDYEKITVTINRKLKQFEKIVVKYKQPIKINELDGKKHVVTFETSFLNFKPNSISNKTAFSEKNYFSVDGKGRLIPTKKYYNYKIVIPEEEY